MPPAGRAEPLSLPRHESRERSRGGRGRGFGLAHRDAVAVTVATYSRLLAETAGLGVRALAAAGERVGAALVPRWPELVEELEGIAAGAGVAPELLLAVNARTE